MTNFIQRTSGLLSKQECDGVIDFFESNKERQVGGTIGEQEKHDPKSKIDTEIFIDLKELCGDRRLNPVVKALNITFEEYVKNYPFWIRKKLGYPALFIGSTIAKIIVILSIVGSILFLPSVGMYYGFHNWTASLTNGVVDARFIAIINTALESPLGQVSMIPLLAWIAKNAPSHLKATFFAIFASFTNLALSANALGTKYLNEIFTITREVKDKVTNAIVGSADYSELGILLITVTLLTLIIPIIAVWIIQNSKFKTNE